jgi:toxin FitB
MTNGFILDTCVLSETSRVKPHPQVIRFINTASNLVIPAAAIMEFQQGIAKLHGRDPPKAAELSAWYQRVMSSGIPILSTGKEIAEIWGTLAAHPRMRNFFVSHPNSKRLQSGQDLHVAAASLASGIPIATFNVRDFLLIDSCFSLPGIYDPREEKWCTQHAQFHAEA